MKQLKRSARRGRLRPLAGRGSARGGGVTVAGEEIRLVLGSRLEYLDAVHRVSEEIGRAAGLSRTQAFELSLAVREAFVNALTHGNNLDRRKKVRLTYRVEGDAVRVCVGDQGPGFSLDHAPDPLAAENLTRPEGRGIFLMRNYVDEVVVRRAAGRGARICLLKRRRGRSARGAMATGRRRA